MWIPMMSFAYLILRWLMYVWQFFKRCIYTHDENPSNPKLTVCVTFKSFKVKKLKLCSTSNVIQFEMPTESFFAFLLP